MMMIITAMVLINFLAILEIIRQKNKRYIMVSLIVILALFNIFSIAKISIKINNFHKYKRYRYFNSFKKHHKNHFKNCSKKNRKNHERHHRNTFLSDFHSFKPKHSRLNVFDNFDKDFNSIFNDFNKSFDNNFKKFNQNTHSFSFSDNGKKKCSYVFESKNGKVLKDNYKCKKNKKNK